MSRTSDPARKSWSAEEERDFTHETTVVNLHRCKIAAIAGSMISLWTSGLSLLVPGLQLTALRACLGSSLLIYAMLTALRFAVLRPTVSDAWRRAYVLTFAVMIVVICDGFFVVLSRELAAVSAFSRGMLVVAVVFVLPPSRYIPLALANMALLCGWLAWRGTSAATLMAFLDGTAGAVVGSVVSLVLYAGKRAEFRQQRLIRSQNAEMNELMAITAHDLRSPLLGMKNLLALATTRADLGRDRLLAVAHEAARACDRMLELVSGLVSAHAAEQTAGERIERGDLRVAFAAAVERARALGQSKGIRVEASAPEKGAPARFDAAALAQVLDNLFGNAVKFSPVGARIEAVLRANDRMWRIEISDEGPGVPERERGRLFQKYARGTVPTTGGEGGSGLGLFIAKTLAERMGGRVLYARREPRGSSFSVELPHASSDNEAT